MKAYTIFWTLFVFACLVREGQQNETEDAPSVEATAPTAGGKMPTFQDEEDMKVKDKTMIHQSPIDIKTKGWRKKRETFMVPGDTAFNYRYGSLSYEDATAVGSHGVVFSFKEKEQGHFTTSVTKLFDHDNSNMTFIPKQFHFHSGTTHANPGNMGSEHTFDGRHFSLELHIVHLNMNPKTQDKFVAAVIGVMFKATDTTKLTYADLFLRKLFSGEEVDTERELIDHLDLIHRFVYRGSLTTPAYSEMLLWNMVARVGHINYETLRLFRHKLPLKKGSDDLRLFGMGNRAVQPYNGRKVYEIVSKSPHE